MIAGPSKGPDRNRSKSKPGTTHCSVFVAVAVIPAKAGIQFFFWIPGRVSLARNDDSTFPQLSNSGSPPAEPGVYLMLIS
jgi:hypothetical protein